MNYNKSKKVLRKINVLFSSLHESEEEPSSIESDLLRSYIRQFYEYVLDTPGKTNATNRKKKGYPKSEKKEFHTMAPQYAEREQKQEKEEQPVPQKVGQANMKKDNGEKFRATHPELQELFDSFEVIELSDKLSMRPLKDLSKSMGINEKVFTIQELFKGETQAFNVHIEKLNSLHDYEEAKHYLAQEIALKYDWTDDRKIKKAAAFIKLVRRRYL